MSEMQIVLSADEAVKYFNNAHANKQTKVYNKTANVHARLAKPGEVIATYTGEGEEETFNRAQIEQVVVKNSSTMWKEEQLVGIAKFLKLYEADEEDLTGEWKEFSPKPETRYAVQYTGQSVRVVAPWGTQMPLNNGDYLVTAKPGGVDVYRIKGNIFAATYTEIENSETAAA